MIVKNRDDGGDPWAVYTKVTGKDKYLYLNTTASAQPLSEYWGSAEPTSTVFGVGTGLSNNRGTDDMVAYCFAPIEGYSAFGSYTGNGSADGPFVYTGHRSRWLLVKCSSTTGAWILHDTARTGYNVMGNELRPDDSTGEYAVDRFDIVSNGFKVRSSNATLNSSGATYVYAAFAEYPFRSARAR